MNEWGRVKRVLIGTATRAKLPRVNEHTRYVYYADRDADSVLPQGNYSQTIIDEANEDLDTLANIYKDFGAEVERPNMSWSSDRHHALSTRHYSNCGRSNYYCTYVCKHKKR